MIDDDGDPELDLDAAIAEEELRELFAAAPLADPGAVNQDIPALSIADLIAQGWPDGMPPTVEELAADPGYAEFLAAVGEEYDSGTDADAVIPQPDTAEHHGFHDTFSDSDHDPGWGSSDGSPGQDSW